MKVNIWKWINDILSNQGYATIIAAVIGAIAAIVAPIIAIMYTKRKNSGVSNEEESESETKTFRSSVVPPRQDPLSKLKTDPCNLKGIDQMEFGSEEYMTALITRIEMTKEPDSTVEAYMMEDK